MPPSPHRHVEKHFTATDLVRDIIIGMSDGLTVPFALAAGLTGAAEAIGTGTQLIVLGGIAEIAAGSIAMGLGGYLAARSDAEHYASEKAREEREIIEKTEAERQEVFDVFMAYGLTRAQSAPLVDALQANPKAWIDFMMRFELGLEEPQPTRARNSAATIAASYIVGGLIPLSPYMVLRRGDQVGLALWLSVGITLLALIIFGYIKGRLTGSTPIRSSLQTALVGGLAAAAAFLIAKWIA